MIQSYPAALANQVVSGAFRALIFAPGLTRRFMVPRPTERRPRWACT